MAKQQQRRSQALLWLVASAVLICRAPARVQAEGAETHRKAPANASQTQACVKLLAAVRAANVEEVRALLDHGADVECPSGDQGETPLMQAASGGALEVVKLLVRRGAKINPKGTFHGRTPLTQAALSGHLDVVQLLVAQGADVNANCTQHGHSGYLAFEGVGPRDPTPLGSAAEGGKTAVVEYLIQKGANVNGQDGSSYTPLMWACAGGNPQTVRALLQHGADVTIKTDLGQTARSLSAARHDTAILALLDGVSVK